MMIIIIVVVVYLNQHLHNDDHQWRSRAVRNLCAHRHGSQSDDEGIIFMIIILFSSLQLLLSLLFDNNNGNNYNNCLPQGSKEIDIAATLEHIRDQRSGKTCDNHNNHDNYDNHDNHENTIARQAWSRPDPSLSSALWRLQKRPTQSSRRCRSKTGKPQNRPLGCPRLWKGGRPSGWWGKSIWSKHNCGKKQKMALPRSDWGQQVCFQLDKQTNRQVDNGQVVGIYHLTIFPPDQDQPCVFNW